MIDRVEPLQVVATAGHVDHGKSSLITRLTGIDPDRLAEEKRRGLTIDLGFAWATLPSGREVGFVDVPGHERFVRTMLAGVGPVRLVLFVVAADEGWRRQTEEHLAIIDVLGVTGAVVALTKRDLVDADRLEDARMEVIERVRGSALEGATVVSCSSETGEGVNELVGALDDMVANASAPPTDGRTRLFVDRVFPVAGAGTVVTGTLTGGPLAVGDEAEVLPTGVRARIRSLQTHKRQIEVARPVSRVAVNLAGVDRSRLTRGDVLAHPERWHPTSLIEAKIRPVRGLAHELTSRGAFSFHAGAADRDAKLHLYAVRSVPDDGAFVRIYLSAAVVLDVHDRFVLRESGRSETVAGGVVLDTFPPRRAGATAIDRLTVREQATRDELAELLVSERGAVPVADVRIVAGTDPSDIANARRARDWWVHDRVAHVVRDGVTAALTAFHDASPHAEGHEMAAVRRDIVAALRRAGAPSDAELADALLARLVDDGTIERAGSLFRLPGRTSGIATEEVEAVARAVADAEPTPPTVAELQQRGFSSDAIDAAVRQGVLVRIAPDLVLTRSMVDRAIEVVREAGAEGSTVSKVRERLGTSRRYAVPLMEHLDRTGATRRSGDLRFARGT
ncbi:MAG TPA: selenocysteine-specific translation elongation factor [Actinomycetota bacterium]|jgi:selenocysteine-specific elongation factor|nr:selenocysteine-specific translation elongation factor [Actinomycetota bacterium]